MSEVGLTSQRASLIAEIDEAFWQVDRKQGRTWAFTRSLALQNVPLSGAESTEEHWAELTERIQERDLGSTRDAFTFRDPIGFRFYFALAMIRALRQGQPSELLTTLLVWDSEHEPRKNLVHSAAQTRCVASFVRLMARVAANDGDQDTHDLLSIALDEYWDRAVTDANRLEALAFTLKEEIYDAFRDVTRTGGVCWSETEVMDRYGTEEEARAARARDIDISWHQVIDDPNFQPALGVGGFAFLDPIGYRYYLPAAMIQWLQGDEADFVLFSLSRDSDYAREQQSLLNADQRQCVRRFLEYIVANDGLRDECCDAEHALKALAQWSEASEEKSLTGKHHRSRRE